MSPRCFIPARFNGPAASGNGGYSSGIFAAAGAQPGWERAVVTLRMPPPLDTDLTVKHGDGETYVRNGEDLIATVTPGSGEIPVVPPVAADVAERCEADFAGHEFHAFPRCFACGVARPGDDGLALRPGPVPGRPLTVACTWRPDASVADASVADAGGTVPAEIVWAALDCPGAWPCDLAESPMVLGRMSAHIDRLPTVGERYVVVGAAQPPEGRKVVSHTALYTEDGTLLAAASAIWITIPAGDVQPSS